MKKTIFIGSVFLILFSLSGCATTTPQTKETNITKPTKKSATTNLDSIAKDMMVNNEIRKFLCDAVNPDCEDIFIYEWQKIGNDNIVVFVSEKRPIEWQNDPFKFSPKQFKVDLENGDVYQKSAHDGSFSLITNINK